MHGLYPYAYRCQFNWQRPASSTCTTSAVLGVVIALRIWDIRLRTWTFSLFSYLGMA